MKHTHSYSSGLYWGYSLVAIPDKIKPSKTSKTVWKKKKIDYSSWNK